MTITIITIKVTYIGIVMDTNTSSSIIIIIIVIVLATSIHANAVRIYSNSGFLVCLPMV
jgi:hypothetical protein